MGTREVKAIYTRFLQFHWQELILNRSHLSRSTPSTEVDQRKKAALSLVHCGELSRASRVLTSQGFAPATDDTVAQLLSKHPHRMISSHRPEETSKVESDSVNPISLKKEAFFNAIRKAPRGSGAGPSGWRYEHLNTLLENDLTCELLYLVCSLIAGGKVPNSVLPLLTASRLIALPKANDDVRPIAIGEVIRRATAKAICSQMNSSFASYFKPIQHGIATPGGAELLVHHLSFLMENNPGLSVLCTDVKNAFNSVSRDSILSQVMKVFPEIYHHVRQMYDSPSTLIYVKGKDIVKLQSEEGVHQGDPLGPVLFSIALQPIIASVQDRHQDTTMLAYLDDVYVVGLPESSISVFDDVKGSLKDVGLTIRDEKCKLYYPDAPEHFATTVPITRVGVHVLGTPIGAPSYIQSSCTRVAQDGSSLCSKLKDLDDPQCSLLLLRHCHVPKMNHLARTISPRDVSEAAGIHDLLTRKTFTDIIGLDRLDDTKWKQASLKIKFGGFGLTSIRGTAPAAFLAAWAHSLKELPNRFPSMCRDLENLYQSSPKNDSSTIRSTLYQAVSNLPPKSNLDDEEEVIYHTLEEMIKNPRKLQHRLSTDIFCMEAATFTNRIVEEKDAGRMRSLQGRGAGGWLETVPTSDKHALKQNEFRLASCLRLGVCLPFSQLLVKCECGAELDREGYHLITCKYGGGPVWTHNTLVSGWSECLSDLLICHQIEPRHRYIHTEDRPDITFYDVDSGTTKEIDVAMAHPWSKDTIKGASTTCGYAATKREARKEVKYRKESLPDGSKPFVTPLVFEHFGRWGPKAEEFLNELAKKSKDMLGRKNEAAFRSYWRRFSVIIQKCNSRVVLRKLSRLSLNCLDGQDKLEMDKAIHSSIH